MLQSVALLVYGVLAGEVLAGGRDVRARDGGSVSERAIQRRSGFIEWDWSVDTPGPSDFPGTTSFYDMHEETGDWFALETDEAGQELNTNGDRIGYRLTHDPSSSIIWTFSSSSIVAVADEFDGTSPNEDLGFSIDMSGSLDATYASTTPSNSSSSSTDPWTSTSSGTVLPLSNTLQVQNSECNGSLDFTIATVDANGVTQVYTGTDNLQINMPTALPANATITSSNTTAGVVLVYNGIQPVSVLLGDGDNVPVPRANLAAVVQYCPD